MQNEEMYQEELYEYFYRIANHVLEDLTEQWTDFCVGCMFDRTGNFEFLLYASCNRGDTWTDYVEVVFEADYVMEGIFKAQDECVRMYEFCAENSSCWSSFALRVQKDGKFDADFSYDVIPMISDYVKKVWKGKNLKC